MLRFEDGRLFAAGSTAVLPRPFSERESADKLFVRVLIDDKLETEAAVDTGGVYRLLSPDAEDLLDLTADDAMGSEMLNVRGFSLAGNLHRVSLRILSDSGIDTVIDATALVVRLRPGAHWGLPDVILGWHGCLERLRFAVDPVERTFYFGTADEG